jgi:hypothetical protein
VSDGKYENKSGPVPLKKGYTPAPKSPTSMQDGYKPTTGTLGTPPTSGTVVAKPPAKKG